MYGMHVCMYVYMYSIYQVLSSSHFIRIATFEKYKDVEISITCIYWNRKPEITETHTFQILYTYMYIHTYLRER